MGLLSIQFLVRRTSARRHAVQQYKIPVAQTYARIQGSCSPPLRECFSDIRRLSQKLAERTSGASSYPLVTHIDGSRHIESSLLMLRQVTEPTFAIIPYLRPVCASLQSRHYPEMYGGATISRSSTRHTCVKYAFQALTNFSS